jgi:hypothetical protein
MILLPFLSVIPDLLVQHISFSDFAPSFLLFFSLRSSDSHYVFHEVHFFHFLPCFLLPSLTKGQQWCIMSCCLFLFCEHILNICRCMFLHMSFMLIFPPFLSYAFKGILVQILGLTSIPQGVAYVFFPPKEY